MKLWMKIGFIIGLIGGLIGDIRLYFIFRAMNKPLGLGMFGKVGELATFSPSIWIKLQMYVVSFIGWFIVSLAIGLIIGLIVEKLRK